MTRKDDRDYCPQEENPVDLGSRGVLSNRLKGNELWKGPRWLSGPENGYPVKEEIRNTSESLEEIKKTVVIEIQVNKTGEMGEGRPTDDDGRMVEDVVRDNVGERRPRRAAALDARWSPVHKRNDAANHENKLNSKTNEKENYRFSLELSSVSVQPGLHTAR